LNLKDSKLIAADRNEVWLALLSAEVLQQCVPGCKEMSGSPEEGFEATVVQKVGPVKATFKGAVTLSDIVEGESLTLSGEGKGGAAGFAKGGAKVVLTDEEGGTLLSYDVEAKVGGKLAQLGSRIIDGFRQERWRTSFLKNSEILSKDLQRRLRVLRVERIKKVGWDVLSQTKTRSH
jgi:carbon monoxide dehydrogenase subunit G